MCLGLGLENWSHSNRMHPSLREAGRRKIAYLTTVAESPDNTIRLAFNTQIRRFQGLYKPSRPQGLNMRGLTLTGFDINRFVPWGMIIGVTANITDRLIVRTPAPPTPVPVTPRCLVMWMA